MKGNKLPTWLAIKQSGIPGAGLGIFTQVDIKKGMRIGEYTGRHLTPKQYEQTGDHVYAWELKEKNVPVLYIDGRHPKYANWTRFVNCPRSRVEENVAPMQIDLRMYYYAKRRIQAGEELLIWYGSTYGKWLLGKTRLD